MDTSIFVKNKLLISIVALLIIISYFGSDDKGSESTNQNNNIKVEQVSETTNENKTTKDDVVLISNSSLTTSPEHNKYEVWLDNKSGKYLFSFTPYLPKNDSSLYSFFLDAVDATYKDDSLEQPLSMHLEPIGNDTNAVVTTSKMFKYFAVPAKDESDGSIQSILFWRARI